MRDPGRNTREQFEKTHPILDCDLWVHVCTCMCITTQCKLIHSHVYAYIIGEKMNKDGREERREEGEMKGGREGIEACIHIFYVNLSDM